MQNFNRVWEKSSVSDPLHSMVMGHFNDYVKLKICHQKNAYLLSDLKRDSDYITDDFNVENIYSGTKTLKRDLEKIPGIRSINLSGML